MNFHWQKNQDIYYFSNIWKFLMLTLKWRYKVTRAPSHIIDSPCHMEVAKDWWMSWHKYFWIDYLNPIFEWWPWAPRSRMWVPTTNKICWLGSIIVFGTHPFHMVRTNTSHFIVLHAALEPLIREVVVEVVCLFWCHRSLNHE